MASGTTILGILIILVSLILAPFTCFISLIGVVVGIVLMYMGQKEESKPYLQPTTIIQQPPQRQEEPKSIRTCVSCGRQISFTANVCEHCGHDYREIQLPKEPSKKKKHCENCGRSIPIDSLLCSYCGKK